MDSGSKMKYLVFCITSFQISYLVCPSHVIELDQIGDKMGAPAARYTNGPIA